MRRPSTRAAFRAACAAASATGRTCWFRLHRADVVATSSLAGHDPFALRRFAEEGRGVLVYLRDGTAGVP
jgi:3,4-dihydroxy 2-butanone 4-phosphate synthase/GTP cyclohydrolase II